MQSFDLAVKERVKVKKSLIKQQRRDGFVPAVAYSKKKGNNMLQIDRPEIDKAFRSGLNEASLINLQFEGGKGENLAILKDVQRHPITEEILHIDFLYISMDEPITTMVPIHLIGTAEGTKEGGIVEHGVRDIEIEALPSNIPSVIELDVTPLGLGKSLHVYDLSLENAKILTNSSALLAKVEVPRGADVAEEEEEDATAEPEVIEKGKKEAEE